MSTAATTTCIRGSGPHGLRASSVGVALFKDDTGLRILVRDAAGVSVATAYRYVHEGIDVIAARPPELSDVLARTHLGLLEDFGCDSLEFIGTRGVDPAEERVESAGWAVSGGDLGSHALTREMNRIRWWRPMMLSTLGGEHDAKQADDRGVVSGCPDIGAALVGVMLLEPGAQLLGAGEFDSPAEPSFDNASSVAVEG